jgi:hypothetical protein
MGIEIFKDRKLVIATKHKKDRVIAAMLEKAIEVNCTLPLLFDTDELGTFSGEVERKLDPLSTARLKCERAMEETGCDLAIASEGSFGQHPTIIFAPADDEIVLLVDRKNNLEVIGRKISTDTNFGGKEISSVEEGLEFAQKKGFPDHAMILRNDQNSVEIIQKNINEESRLIHFLEGLFKNSKTAWIETDMRALYNPKRMKVIEEATDNLIQNILNCCPACDAPGFQVDEVESGLPCGLCSMPTRSTLAFKYRCSVCNSIERKLNPHGKENENPMYCDLCNP